MGDKYSKSYLDNLRYNKILTVFLSHFFIDQDTFGGVKPNQYHLFVKTTQVCMKLYTGILSGEENGQKIQSS